MPAKTSASTILPERSFQKQAIAITASKQRCDYRRQVVRDNRLSLGARLLYVELDDTAGLKADTWPHRETLAGRFAVSSRQIRRWLSELSAAAYIRRRRTGRGDHYYPCWGDENGPSEGTETSSQGGQECPLREDKNVRLTGQKCPLRAPVSLYEPEQETEQQQAVDVVDHLFGEIGKLING